MAVPSFLVFTCLTSKLAAQCLGERGQIMGIWESIKKKLNTLKEHVVCILLVAGIIVIATIVVSFGESNQLAQMVGLAASVLSIVFAIIVFGYMLLQTWRTEEIAKETKQLIRQTHKEIQELPSKITSEGEKLTATDTGKIDRTGKDYKFDPTRVSWMTLIALYCISKAQEKGRQISKLGISSGIDGVLRVELSINYTMIGIHSFLEGVIYGLMCFLPESDITSKGDVVIVKNLPESFTKSVEQRIKQEEEETSRGKKVFGTLRPVIDAYFS